MSGLPDMPALACADCGSAMVLSHHPNGTGALLYRCIAKGCNGWLGATKKGKPVGVPGDQKVREARADCQDVFDRLWRSAVSLYTIEETDLAERDAVLLRIRTTAKSRTLKFIAMRVGIPAKAAKVECLTDLHVLRKFWHVANEASAEQVRDWAKAQKEEVPS